MVVESGHRSFLTAEDFSCEIEPDGKIAIMGVIKAGEKKGSRTPKSFRCNHKLYAHRGTSLSHSKNSVQELPNLSESNGKKLF